MKTARVGSLPPNLELVPLLIARDHGESYDAAAFDQSVERCVFEAIHGRSTTRSTSGDLR